MTIPGDTLRYRFVTSWRIEGDVAEVAAILYNGADLPRWWPSVYVEATPSQVGDDRGVGFTLEVHSKGWLPYHLHWTARIVEVDLPHGYTLEASGDFVGRGVWTLRQDGGFVDVTYDWEILVEKPLLRRLYPVARPVFAANHRWAMARGLESLRLELARRHAASDAERDAIPAPPGPTPDLDARALGAVAAGAAFFLLLLRRRAG